MKKILLTLSILAFSSPAYAQAVAIRWSSGAKGDATITAGSTVQTIFGGAIPEKGYEICNGSATQDLWIRDTGTAAPNQSGSVHIGVLQCYRTPDFYKPYGAVSVYGTITGQPLTAKRW